MADYDINNANEFVPDTLPKSAIGRGGLSAMAIAARGSPQAPRPMLGGGLVTDEGQSQLEKLLFPRVRTPEQLDEAAGQRRGALAQLQQATTAPQDSSTGLDNIVLGMMKNDQPWDVGNGFRNGVAGAIASKFGKEKQAYDANVKSADLGLKFEEDENKDANKLDSEAVTNLRALAKPIKLGGAGGAGGAGVRFKTMPGVGMVDTWDLDEEGKPKVVYADSKMLTDVRSKAVSMAEKEAESEKNRINFKDDDERKAFIQRRADELTFGVMSGAAPAPALGSTGKVDPRIIKGLKLTESSGDPLAINPKTKALGAYQFLPETVAMLHRKGFKFNPFDEDESAKAADYLMSDLLEKNGGNLDKALAAYGGFVKADPKDYIAKVKSKGGYTGPATDGPPADGGLPIVRQETQKARNKTAEEVAKAQVDQISKFKDEATAGQNMISTVNELKQLKFNPGMFAKWKQRGGNLAEAFGNDGPLAKMAAQSGNAESLLQSLSNARISLEKGVQTRDDEIRFKNEIAKITDPKAAFDYMLKHMNEMGLKAQEKANVYEDFRHKNGGVTYDGADKVWEERQKQYGGMVKKYGGGFVGRSEFINAIVSDPANVKAYKGDKAALQQRAEKEWQNLGGK